MKANDTIDSYQMYSSIRLDVNTAEMTSWCIYNPSTFWVHPLPNSSDFPSLNYFFFAVYLTLGFSIQSKK